MDLDDLYRLLRGAHVQAQGVVDTLRDPLLVLDPELTVVSANPAFYSAFEASRDGTVGTPFYELGNGQWDIEDLRFLLERVIPRSASIIDYEVEAEFPDLGRRIMLVGAQRLVHPDNGRRLLLLTIVDATARRKNERGKDLLLGEVHHRMKNLLSVTQALARQTSVTGRTAEQYRDAFLGRFQALGESMEISTGRDSAELPELARAVLRPYLQEGRAIAIGDGPQVPLPPDHATAVGLILHELATNAAKYGALSVAEGRVVVDWDVSVGEDGVSGVEIRWSESGGPETSPPSSEGFGTRLIHSAAKGNLEGSAELNYTPDGLVATIRFPLGKTPEMEGESDGSARPEPEVAGACR